MVISKKIYALILFSVPVVLHADEVRLKFNQVSEHNKERAVKKIKAELENNARQKKVIAVGALAGLGYITYQFFYGGETAPKPVIVPAEVVKNDQVPVIIQPEKSEHVSLPPEVLWYLKNEAAKARAKDNLSLIPWVYYWAKENFYLVAQQTVVLAVFTGLNNSLGPISKYISLFDGAVDKFIARVFHEGNLAWFLKQHTQLPLLFARLEYHAAKLENQPTIALNRSQTISLQMEKEPEHPVSSAGLLTSEERNYHALQLQCTWNVMLQQIEAVLGFMEFSCSRPQWYSLAILQAQALQTTVRDEFDHCAHLLEDIVYNDINNFEMHFDQTMLGALQKLHMNIEQDLNSFADLERLKPY